MLDREVGREYEPEKLATALGVSQDEAEIIERYYSGKLSALTRKAKEVIKLRNILRERLGELAIVNSDDWSVDMMKMVHGSHDKVVSEMWVRVNDARDVERVGVYSVRYYHLPGAEWIESGFHIYRHNTPDQAEVFDEAFEEKWSEIPNDDPLVRELIGVTLWETAPAYAGLNEQNLHNFLQYMPEAQS